MPTIQNTSRGQVVQIWGKAYIRGTDGVWRPLALGEVVPQGSEILTEQNAIVMMARDEKPLPVIAPAPALPASVDLAITALDSGNAQDAPAAGLTGGGGGDLQPGLRIDRIVESVTAATLATGPDANSVAFGLATRSDPAASADAPRLIAASSSIAAVEAGGSVNLGLLLPSGAGASGTALTVNVSAVPTIGQVFTAAGAVVVAGSVLDVADLAGLTYVPPADYAAGTPVGPFSYTVSNGIDSADGGTQIAVTPVNDAPRASGASLGGNEDILIDIGLQASDVDGAVARFVVGTLPANGTLLLADTLSAATAGQSLTPAQAATLVFRPAANWNGSASFTFSAVDNEGAVSSPATVTLTVSAVNDPPVAVADSASTVAQAPVTVAVLGNDSDADNHALSVTAATLDAALGSVVVNGDGTLTFTAAAGVTGPVAISYTIADPSGATSTATLSVNVAAAPTVSVDAPALTNDSTPTLVGSSNMPAGSTVTLTVSDAGGAVQTFTTTVRADGSYGVDVPAALAEGPYTALASVDGPGGSSASANDSGVVDITPPVITIDAPALTSDSTPPLTGSTDLPAGSTVALTVTGANGVSQLFTTTVQAGGSFAIDVPAALVNGPFSVLACGTDAAGNSASASDNGVVDSVAPVITVDAPALTNDSTPPLTGSTDLPAGSTVTLTVTGANGAAQTLSATVQADGSYAVSVPAALVEGNFSVLASGTDAAGNSASASDSGVVDTTAPTIAVDAPALTNDATPQLTGSTNLPAGATVSLTVTGANGAVQTFSATVQAGGTFAGDVPAALVQGPFSVSAIATDAAGNSASAGDNGGVDTTPPAASITIDPVTADNIVNAGEAGGSLTLTGTVGGDVQVGDTVTLNVNGVAYSGLVLAGNTFAIDVPGSAVLADADRRIDGSVTTTDAAGNSTTATAQRAYAVNTAPIAVDDALSAGEDAASAGGDVTPGTAAQDRDADGDTLTVIGVAAGVQPSASGNVNTPLAGTWGTLLLDGLGAYTYAPSPAAQALDPGQSVTDTFTYTISDGRGGSATATLTVSVVGADDPTTVSGVFVGSVTEDAVASAGGALAASDPDVGARTFVAQTNSAGSYGTFSIDSAGTWSYALPNAAANVQALAPGQSVTETFVVAADDGTTASITVTVNGSNDAPVVSSTSITAVEEGAPIGLGLAAPSDVDNGSVLAITVTGLPTIGQVQMADGTPVANGATLSAAQLSGLRYLPPADYAGAPVGAFAYTVSDGLATVAGGTTISVSAVNDRPVAIDASASDFEDSATRIAVSPAGSDVDGSVTSYTLTSVPANGALYAAATGGAPLAAGAVVTGPVYFQPNANFNGTVSFDYTVTDNSGAVSASTATATIVVNPVDDAPTGADATVTIAEDGSRSFGSADLDFSDTDVGDTLAAVRIDTLPVAGTLTLGGLPVSAGQVIPASQLATLVFTPVADASGSPYASFTFSVQDNVGLFDTAPNTITVNVTPVNDPPLAVVTPASGDEDTPIAVPLTGSDIDGTVTAVTVTALPANGVLFLADGVTPVAVNTPLSAAAAASLIFRPAPDFNGSVDLTFTVTDNNGAVSAPAVLPITVAPVVDPAISVGDVTVNEAAGTVTFTVTLDQPTTATVAVNFATSAGSAADGADYSGGSGTLTFAPGVTTQTITLAIADDGTYEGAETFSVLLTGPVNATIANATGVATIRDDGSGAGGSDDDRPTIAVSSPAVGEGGAAVFTVSLSNPSTGTVTFAPTLSSGSATVGSDTSTALEFFDGTAWVAVPVGGVTIAAGDTSVQLRVATSDDFAAEGDETFDLTATVTAGTTANASASGTATIGDDSDAVSLVLSASPAVAEGGAIVYTATLTQAAVTPLNLTLSNGAVIAIAAGATTGSVPVPAPTDDLHVDAGSVSATIAGTVGGGFESLVVNPAAATTTVTDTIDVTTVSITGDAIVAEGATAAYTVSLTSAAQTVVTVNLAYSGTAADGSDFSGVTTVTIPAGASSAGLNIATLQDVLGEGSENFTVTITSASGGNFEALAISGTNGAQATQIVDDDTPSIAVSSPTVGEGGFAVFTVSLSNPSTGAVTFDPVLSSGTATVGTDTGTALEYFDGTAWVDLPVGGVTIGAGDTSVQVRVATTDDFAAEGSEQFTLTANVTAGLTANASATGTASVTDNIDATTVSLSATPSVAEGGTITYTATLNHAAVTAMTVTLSTAQTITIAAGATSGSVTLGAPSDDPYIDAGSVSRSIASTSGGGLEALTIDGTAAVTAVGDTVDTTTATLTATPSVAEGGTITYTVSLNAPVTGSDVSVLLANGQTVTIPVGSSSGSVSAVAPDNVYGGGTSVGNAIVSASGGNFEQLTPNTTPVSTAVTDDGDVTTVSLAATPSIVEGGTIVYTATLTSAAQTPVTVTLSNGAVIMIGAGAAVGTVSVAAPGDDPHVDASTVSATISTATGGNFENLQVDATPATTSVTDDIDITSVSLSATPSVAEGGSIVYIATLTNPAGTALYLTLSTGQIITIAAGTTSGSVSIAAPADDVFVDAGSVSRSIASALGGNFESLVVDATPATTAVTDTIDTTTVSITGDASLAEGATASYTVSLTSPAQTAVTVNLTYSGTATDGSDFTGTATVTIPAGASSANFSLATLQDVLAEGAESFSVSVASAAGGNFEALAISATNGSQTTSITDDDTPTISVSSPTVVEGGMAVFTVSLSNPSTSAITFTPALASGTATVGTDTSFALEFFNGTAWVAVPGGGITLAPGSTSVQVRVATTDDVAAEGSEAFTLTATVSAGLTANASATGTATITDDVDAATLVLGATPSVAEGGTIVYTATLSNAAVSPLTVTLSTGQTITIASGASSGTVSILAPTDDPHLDAGTVSRTITSAAGGNFELLTIDPAAALTTATDDNDVTAIVLSATPSVAEGGTIVYTATLTNAAQTPVTVTLSTGQTITIAAGATSGSVSIAAPGDDVYVDATTVSRTISTATGGNFEALTINPAAAGTSVTDTVDTATLSITGSTSVAEGASGSYTVSLTSVAQTAITVTLNYSGTALNGTDFTGAATVTIPAGASSANFSIAALDDLIDEVGAESFTVAIGSTSGGNFENLVVSGSSGSVTTTVTDNDAAPTVSVSSPTVAEGGGFAQFTVSLSNPSSTATTFSLALANGSATGGGTDYGSGTATNLQVSTDGGANWFNAATATIAANASSVLVRTPILNDALDETAETFTLTATRTAGTTANASASGTTTITDDDATPSLSIGNVSVNESAGTMTFTVTLSAASGLPVSVGYATSNGTATAGIGADYTAGSGTLTFAAGVTSQTVTVTIAEDTVFEGSETLNVTLSGATNASVAGTGVGIGTILDNDLAPTISAVSSPSVTEGANLVYAVTLSNASSNASTFPFSLGGGSAIAADYGSATFSNGVTLAAGVLTVPAGVTAFSITVPTVDDVLDEASETVPVTVGGVTGTGTIVDNDPTPTLSVNDVSVNESAGTMTFTVTLSATSGQTVTASYATGNGTAVAGGDYTAAAGTVTFAPGQTSQTITVPLINDTVNELAETLYVNLTAPTNATIADGLGVGTILDDDAVPAVATVSAAAVAEGGGLVHTVTLTNAGSTTATLGYALTGVSATAGTDYDATPTFSNGVTLSGGLLSVPAGVTSFTVTVTSSADTIDEPTETYNLSIGGVTAVGTMNDDDAAPTLSVSNVTVNESAGFAVFSVALTNPSSGAVNLGLALTDGTAVGGSGGGNSIDYGNNTRMEVSTDGGTNWTTGTTATIAAGQTSVLVRTTVNTNSGGSGGDAATETFTLTATRTSGTTVNANAIGTATILEENITITSAAITEGTGSGTNTGTLTVSISPAFAAATTLPFTLGGTALSPADYGTLTFSNGVSISGGSITIPSGVASFTITVPVVRDALDEEDETVTVNIAGSTGTLTVNDDDATPTLAIGDVTVNEGAGTATFTVTLSAASGQTVTVNYSSTNQTALSGVDFSAVSGTLTFAPGTTTQTVTVPILQDTVYEGSETFRITLATPTNASISDGTGIGTIADNGTGSGGTDNDTPLLAVSSITVSDQSAGFATFVVSLSNPSTTAIGVSLALANGTATGGGVDYGAAGATNLQVSTDNGVTWANATTATIASGTSYVLVRTPILADVANEVSETFTLSATRTTGTTTNASASGIATINDIYNGPDAVADAPGAMLQEDTPAATVLAGNVIQGGAGNVADTDPNNDTLAITGAAAGNSLVTGLVALASPLTVSGLYGNLVIQADGTYTYTLDNARIQTQNMLGGQLYSDVFSYRVTDGNGGYDTATISVSITGTLDLTAITPQPVAIAADGLQGEYYGYNDTTVAGNRVHADDGTATTLGTGSNLESVEDISAIINGRNATMGGSGSIVGTNIAGATNAADVIFNVRTLNYGTTPVVSSNLGDNSAVAAGNALPPQDNINGSGTTTALANFLDQDAATARVQTGTPTGATVGTQTGLGATTDAIVRMTGFVYLERGNYDFRVTGDDGFRLKVGGETLIEFDGNQPPTTRTFTNVEVNDRISGLTSIELLYWEQGGNANLQFEFKPSDSATWVPFSLDSIAFFSAASAPTLTDTRIQDIVESSVNQQYLLRTGSVLDGDGNTNTLTGAEGRDYVQGFGGDDILNGNGGADYLDGGIGNDTLNGGDGNDILVGGTGNDAMTGGAGDDIYRVDSAGDVVVEVAGAGQGTDTVEFEASYNVGTHVVATNIENALVLGSFNSNVTGNAVSNRITGNDGNNILIGGAGDDRILGGMGNDTLSGDAGALAGGNAGKDIFEWNLADRGTGGAPAIDRITDFTYSGSTTSSAVPAGDLTAARTDVLDLRDLLSGESSSSLVIGGLPTIGNLASYLDVNVAGGDTTIRISSTGGFAGGNYSAAQEDQRIVLTGVNLFTATSTANEADLLQRLLANGTLVVD